MRTFVKKSKISPFHTHNSNNAQMESPTPVFRAKEHMLAETSQRDIEIYKQIFDFFDSNGAAVLTPMDLKRAFILFDYKIPKHMLYQIIADFDADENGYIEFDEFVKMMVMSPCDSDTQNDIRRVFMQMDRGNKGFLSMDDMRDLFLDMHEEYPSDEYIKEFMINVDEKNKGEKVSWEEFLRFNTSREWLK